MTERAAFLEVIKAQPDDTTTPLVFADWLTEQGEGERGELVRLQVELAKLERGWGRCSSYGHCTCRWCVPKARVRELEARLSAWPCRMFHGMGKVGGPGVTTGTCPASGGSGDVFG